MTPEQKRRWLRWMGYIKGCDSQGREEWITAEHPHRGFYFEDFNPDSPDCPHSVWVEIWERLHKSDLPVLYLDAVWRLLKLPKRKDQNFFNTWFFHTCPLDIRCAALDQVIP